MLTKIYKNNAGKSMPQICWLSVFVINVTFIMLHFKFYHYYYNVEFECVFLLCLEWDVMYYGTFPYELITVDN
jgi:hypothetical protein